MDDHLLDLLACLTDRRVDMPHAGPAGQPARFRVRPPSLFEALCADAALQALGSGDTAAWDVLSDACRAWLPDGLFRLYFEAEESALPVYRAAALRDVAALLSTGVRDERQHAADRRKVEAEARRRSWFAVLADYADALGTPPADALRQPFPLFIALSAEVIRLQERRKVDVMMGYAIARGGSEEQWRAQMRAAGYLGAETIAEKAEPGPEWQNDEWVKEQKAKIKAYRARVFGIVGEA